MGTGGERECSLPLIMQQDASRVTLKWLQLPGYSAGFAILAEQNDITDLNSAQEGL